MEKIAPVLQYHSKYKFGELIYESIARNQKVFVQEGPFSCRGGAIHESGGCNQDEVIKIKFNKAVNAESFKLSGQYDFSFIMVSIEGKSDCDSIPLSGDFEHKFSINKKCCFASPAKNHFLNTAVRCYRCLP